MKTKENKILISIFIVLILVSTTAIVNAKVPTIGTVQNSTISTMILATANQNGFKDIAPVQYSIKQAIENGTISTEDIEGMPEYSTEILEQNETHLKLRSKTKIIFKNPRGAGYSNNKWPKFEIEKNIGNIKAGNYDQQIKDYILSDINNIKDKTERSNKLKEWNNYNFENGTRTYEFSEIYDATFPNKSIDMISAISPLSPSNASPSSANYGILMGFTQPIHWEYSREANVYFLWWRVAWARLDADLDAALGLRLPTEVGLSPPGIMIRGQSYNIQTNIVGQDWDASKYSAANVPPENGNEFVARAQFSLTAQAWIIFIGDIGPYTISKNLDYGRSFKTPFGPNEEFPIPDLLLSPGQTGLLIYVPPIFGAGIGLKIHPDLGSDRITANWNIEGDAIGRGSVGYHAPNTNYYLGPVKADDYSRTTDYANIKISDYNYYFSICRLILGANVQAGVDVPYLFWIPIIQTPYVDIYTLDCSSITGGLRLGTHQGTNANKAIGHSLVSSPIILSKNSGFETSDGVEPKYWDKYQTGNNAIFTYPEIGRGGTGKSVAIKYTTKETDKTALWLQQGIMVSPYKQYELSGYMKLDNVNEGRASIRINWYTSDGDLIKVDMITKSGTSPWIKHEKTLTSPSNAAKATIGVDLSNSSGKVWVDDLVFVKES